MRDPTRRIVVVLALLVPLLTWLLFAFRGAVREAVVVPLLYLAWLGELTFRSVDEAVFWGLGLAVVAVLLLSALRREPRARQPLEWPSDTDGREGRRVAFWARRLASHGNESLVDFQSLSQLRKLILAVSAYHARVSPAEMERDVRGRAVELPPELRGYFDPDRRPAADARRRFPVWACLAVRAVHEFLTNTRMGHSCIREKFVDGPHGEASPQAALEAAVRTLEAEIGPDGPPRPQV